MQITNSVPPPLNSPDKVAPAISAEGAGTPAFRAALSAEEIYTRYDFNAITPREIDEMADLLRENDAYDVGALMMLETRGERFQQHLHNTLYQAGIIDSPDFDAEAAFDLIANLQTELDMARRRGDPTEHLAETLDHITKQRSRPNSVSEAARALHQSLFSFQTHTL